MHPQETPGTGKGGSQSRMSLEMGAGVMEETDGKAGTWAGNRVINLEKSRMNLEVLSFRDCM